MEQARVRLALRVPGGAPRTSPFFPWPVMIDVLVRNWGWIALRGGVALLFGLVTFVVPEVTLAVLNALFGAFALAFGLATIVAAVANRQDSPQWGTLLVGGVLSLGFGILALVQPGITGPALHYFVAGWSILVGLAEVAASMRLRREAGEGWLLLMAGVLSVGFGLLLLLFPSVDTGALTLWIGAYAVVFGLLLVVLALALRRLRHVQPAPGRGGAASTH